MSYTWVVYHSQRDNLVPQWKFQIITIVHFFKNWLFSQSTNCKYLHSGIKSCGWLRHSTWQFPNLLSEHKGCLLFIAFIPRLDFKCALELIRKVFIISVLSSVDWAICCTCQEFEQKWWKQLLYINEVKLLFFNMAYLDSFIPLINVRKCP